MKIGDKIKIAGRKRLATVEGVNMKAKQIIKDLVEEGFDLHQIADAICDGEYLNAEGIDQATAEEVFTLCQE